MPLTFRDSLTGRVEPLQVPRRRPLSLYVCGPTVYAGAHVGHGRTYLYFDILRRYFRDRGVPVRHVMNITDFEDKITARAVAMGISWKRLAVDEERRFVGDMDRLHVLRPDVIPRSSAFVPDMIVLIRALEQRGPGHVYSEGDSLYYTPPPDDGTSPNFLSGPELLRHAVPEPGIPLDPNRLPKRDFLLWRRQEPPSPSWASPWGRGAPGWHLECFTMADRHLGIPVDLHGGGFDLMYPHHWAENVISYDLRHAPFSRRYLHTAFVTAARQKMSKSVGNLVLLRVALDRIGPDALRWYLLTPPYQVRLDWSNAEAERACVEFEELARRTATSVAPGAGGCLSIEGLRAVVDGLVASIEDGFLVDRGLERLREWGDELGRAPSPRFARADRHAARDLYGRVEALLGLRLMRPGPVGREPD
jgi:cysteinyl-tRNA synthetase